MQDQSGQTLLEKVRGVIIQNSKKGQLYRIMFANDPVLYEGMPVATADMGSDGDMFEMRLVGPGRDSGVLRRSVRDIIWIERCP